MKNITFIACLILTTYCILKAAERSNPRKRTLQIREKEAELLTNHQAHAIRSDFFTKFQSTIDAFIAAHPDSLLKETRYIQPLSAHIIQASVLLTVKDSHLHLIKEYTNEEIAKLTENCMVPLNMDTLTLHQTRTF